jgi:AraC-like DNA-binding protein
LIYTQYLPAPPLNRYIDDFYYCEGAAPAARLQILPMPTLHLMVNAGQPFALRDSAAPDRPVANTESWFVGIWSRSYRVDWQPQVRFFGIHFKPEGAFPFLRVPLLELHNQVVPLEALWGSLAAELREQLLDAPTPQAGFAILERILLARLNDFPNGLDVVQHAVGKIARQQGALSIQALSDDIGISQKHLGTHFKRLIGIAPKELARFYRFVRVLRLVDPRTPVEWERIARLCHFYDLSHLNREFFALTGYTPTEYFHLPSAAHPRETLGQLPIG